MHTKNNELKKEEEEERKNHWIRGHYSAYQITTVSKNENKKKTNVHEANDKEMRGTRQRLLQQQLRKNIFIKVKL